MSGIPRRDRRMNRRCRLTRALSMPEGHSGEPVTPCEVRIRARGRMYLLRPRRRRLPPPVRPPSCMRPEP